MKWSEECPLADDSTNGQTVSCFLFKGCITTIELRYARRPTMLESGILEVFPGQVTTLHWHKATEEGAEKGKLVHEIINYPTERINTKN